MKFEREKDILAFRDTNSRERRSLRRLAISRDPWIGWLPGLCSGVMFMCFMILRRLISHVWPNFENFSQLLIALAIAIPVGLVFNSLLIIPRIRRALDIPGRDTR